MINTIKGQLQKFIGLEETYPKFTRELSSYSEGLSKASEFSSNDEIDIIMPSFNRVSVTKRAIEYILNTTKVKFNLIIVDNNSNKETKKYLKSISNKHTRVLFLHKNLGGSGSRMEGLKISKSSLVAFVDNDIFPMPYYFENLISTLNKNPQVSAVQSKVVFPNKLIQINRPYFKEKDGWIEFYDKDIDKQFNDKTTEVSENINWMPSGATMWRRSVFENLNFDGDFNTSYEDNEFSYRIGKSGIKFMNNHRAVCLHLSSTFTPSSVEKTYTESRFGNKVVLNSLKQFKLKHGLLLSFGPKEKFLEHMGFKTEEEYEKAIMQ